jgi:hypothetical protein
LKTLNHNDINVPENIFDFPPQQRKEIYQMSASILLNMVRFHTNKKELINQVITHSINILEKQEDYEMCEALTQIKKVVNETP